MCRLQTGMTQTDLDKALGGILGTIEDVLAKGESVSFIGFGKFSVGDRAARDGRNPKTGKKVSVPQKQLPVFRTGKDLKERVNNMTK